MSLLDHDSVREKFHECLVAVRSNLSSNHSWSFQTRRILLLWAIFSKIIFHSLFFSESLSRRKKIPPFQRQQFHTPLLHCRPGSHSWKQSMVTNIKMHWTGTFQNYHQKCSSWRNGREKLDQRWIITFFTLNYVWNREKNIRRLFLGFSGICATSAFGEEEESPGWRSHQQRGRKDGGHCQQWDWQ